MAEVESIQRHSMRGEIPTGGVQGTYRGQAVFIVEDMSPSPIQLASTIAGFEATKRKLRPSLLYRSITGKSVFKEKEKILATYTERLGQSSQSKKYKETYSELSRQQYKEEYREEENQDTFRDALLYKVSENFGEVTEQDNVLEYSIAINAMERSTIETEIQQVQKMIEFFSEPQKNFINTGFANSERIKWSEKLVSLEDNLKTNAVFNSQLLRAQDLLRKAHRMEIRDGYNLIPKAAAIIQQHYGNANASESAISLAVAYRDEVLTMKSPLDVFEIFIHRQEKKRESFRPYIDSMIALFGVDMTSSNPSRSKEELHSVRDSLFRVEICGQIYDSIGILGRDIRRMFPEEEAPETIPQLPNKNVKS
ncbi:MAG: hypothetical protein LBN94_02680 [Puniceicoccales bacterium]|nr:hypothetical protein [Puniceicoccales bacterium]